jgi:hypothetical protein
MNTTDDSTQQDSTQQDSTRQDTARGRAERGTGAWEDTARLQRWATPDHADFYALAGEVVATLYALDDLAQVLRRQVAGYGQGRPVYDDTYGRVDPAVRLAAAVAELDGLRGLVQAAQVPANRFWSAIGHIGVEHSDLPDGPGAGDGIGDPDGDRVGDSR